MQLKLTFLLFLLFAFSLQVTAQTMDFEAYDPPSTLVVPEHPKTRAKFPFVDVHSHHWGMATQDLKVLISQMDSMNMGICVNLSGRGGTALKSIMDNVRAQGMEKRIVVFTNISLRTIDDPEWTAETVKQIEYDVKQGAKGLKIYKSQGMDDKDSKGNRIKIDDPRLDPVWAKCGELGIPVLIHAADPRPFWQTFDEKNERWLELKTHPGRKRSDTNPASWETILDEQHHIFTKNPKTTFVNAHFGWYANDLAKLGQLLDAIPNMNIEFGAVIAELGRQPRAAKAFFEKYQDRILFGKDAYEPKEYHTYFRVLETTDEYFPYYKRYHAFWRMYGLGLSDEVLKKVYYKNALRIIPGLDPKVFEK
jgi:predicted TIM-barrel fold metal-dependent hydrolase